MSYHYARKSQSSLLLSAHLHQVVLGPLTSLSSVHSVNRLALESEREGVPRTCVSVHDRVRACLLAPMCVYCNLYYLM